MFAKVQQKLQSVSIAKSGGDHLILPCALFGFYLACIYAIQPVFFSSTNIISLFYYTGLLIPAVLGVHLLIVMGLFDLSIGAIAAASGIVTAQAISYGMPIPIAILAGVCAGILFGLFNWLLVTKAHIPALIGTLITMGAARALAVGVTEGQTLAGLPDGFGQLAQGTFKGIPYVAVFGVLLVLALEFLSQKHVIFRRFYQAGSNRRAVMDHGINVVALECMAFVLAGIGASSVGLLQVSRTLSASPHAFPLLALDCIAACVIGGDNLSGGSGRAVGAFLGTLIVVVSRNLVVLAGVSVYWQDLAIAAILLAAVLLNRFQKGE